MVFNICKFLIFTLTLFIVLCLAWIQDKEALLQESSNYIKSFFFIFNAITSFISFVIIMQTLYYFYDTKFTLSKHWSSRYKNIVALNSALLIMLTLAFISYLITQ